MLVRRVATLTATPVLTLIRGVGAGLVFPVLLTLALLGAREGLEAMGLRPAFVAILGLGLALSAGGGFAWRYERPFIDRVLRKKPAA
jgi:hypothetical protein